MIQIHIVTDDKNQGFKTLASAIGASLDSLGMPSVVDGMTEKERAKLIPKLDQYIPALTAKLGGCEVLAGLPEASASDSDAVQAEGGPEPEYTSEAPSEAQVALENAVKRAQEEKSEVEARLIMASAFDVAADAGEKRILPGYRVERIEGLDGAMGWVIKNAGGWLYSQEHDKMLPGQRPSDDTVITNLARALEVGRLVYKRDLDKKDRMA